MKMYHAATVLTYMNQYQLTTMEDLEQALDGDSCSFSGDLLRLARASKAASERFIKCFEKQINPESKEEWSNGYSQFQLAMDNYFVKEEAYDEWGEGERSKEIARASKLRYHDPYEKNPQRCFEQGFRLGAAYADLHPTGMVSMRTDDGEKEVSIKEIVEYYVNHVYPQSVKVSVEVELNKPNGDKI